MTRKKSSEMTESQKRGRNNKKRGYSSEVSLVKFLTDKGLPAKRVVMSGALKNYVESLPGLADIYRGDVILECGKRLIRVEVKSRKKLPAYVVGRRNDKSWPVKEIDSLCYILTEDEFLGLCYKGSLPEGGIKINPVRCKGLVDWFEQDESEIVAMKEFGKQTWYFAVKSTAAKKIGGKYK